MPHLELIFLHSESADGCNVRRVPAAPVSSDLKIARHLVAGWCQDRGKTCHQFTDKGAISSCSSEGIRWCRKRDTTPGPRKPNNHGLFPGPGSPPLDLTVWTLRKATPSAAGGEAVGSASMGFAYPAIRRY